MGQKPTFFTDFDPLLGPLFWTYPLRDRSTCPDSVQKGVKIWYPLFGHCLTHPPSEPLLKWQKQGFQNRKKGVKKW